MSLIKIENLNFVYKKTQQNIFENAYLEVFQHGIYGLIGSNGSGKTTFFDLLMGQVDGAQISFTSFDFHEDFRSKVLLPQTINVPQTLKVEEVVDFIFALNSSEDENKEEFLNKMSIQEFRRFHKMKDKYFGKCSKNEKLWVMANVVLSFNRKLYLLDEPTADLDSEFRCLIWEKIQQTMQTGATIFVSTDLLAEVAEYANGMYMIFDRKLKYFSSSSDYLSPNKTVNPEEAIRPSHER